MKSISHDPDFYNIYLFFLIIPVVFTILILFTEYIRIYRVKSLLRRICRDPTHVASIGTPYHSLSVFGTNASIKNLIFASKNFNIPKIRANYSDNYKGIYLIYSWSISNLLNDNNLGPALVVTDPKLSSILMSTPEIWVKPNQDYVIKSIIGKSCTAARGADAIRQRKILSKSFSNKIEYEGYLHRASKKFIDSLIEEMSSSVSSTSEGLVKCINIVPRIKALSADIIVWMVFGSDTEGVEDFKAEYIKYWEFLRINSIGFNSSQQEERKRLLLENISNLKKSISRLIQNRRRYMGSSASVDSCILDKLIPMTRFGDEEISKEEEKSPNQVEMLNEEELLHNCYSLITAGFETTAHTLVVSMYHLQTFTAEKNELLHNKKYIKALIKESLRLFPPVLHMIRYALNDTYLGDVLISKGTKVYCDIIGTHYSKFLWGDHPEEFDLNRWITDESSSNTVRVQETNKKRWIPFGYGSKSCIGQASAMMNVESVLVTFLEYFEVIGYKPLKSFEFTQNPSMRINFLELNLKRKKEMNSINKI